MRRQPPQGCAQAWVRLRAGGGFQHLGVAPGQRQAPVRGWGRNGRRHHPNAGFGQSDVELLAQRLPDGRQGITQPGRPGGGIRLYFPAFRIELEQYRMIT